MASGLIGGRYEVLRKIAEGGMGEVFEARHHMTRKIVALKVLFPHIGKDVNAKQRFLREVSAPAQIGHPGIVDVTDSGFDPNDGSLFVAMEYIKGPTMREWIRAQPRTQDAIFDLFDEVLDALGAAHTRGIVHRDLKPDNVMLAEQRDGSFAAKILDFGIARDLDTSEANVTKTGIAMGTPHYMAPEQAMSARGVLATADVWAIGAMLYEALTGQTPFVGETASAVVVHACTAPHPPILSQIPTLSPAIAQVIDRCLEKDPAKRPADAATLQQVLRQARGRAGTPHTQPTPMMTSQNAPTQQGGAGVPPATQTAPGSWGTPTPTPAPGGYTTPAPGGYGSPQPGHATPTPGGYGTPAPGPAGYATPAPGGFGTPPHGTAPVVTPPPGGFGMTSAPRAAPKKSNGLLIGGAALVGVLALGGVGAFVAMSSSSGDPDPQPLVDPNLNDPNVAAGTGTAQIASDVSGGGELFANGVSQGLVVGGGTVTLPAGAQHLELRVGGATVASADIMVVPGQTALASLNRAPQGPQPGEQVQAGTLAAGDLTLQSGEYQDQYTFHWTAGTVHIELRSTAFDPYLIVKPPVGAQLDNDDMTPGNTTAGMDVAVATPGDYQVIVTSYRPGETGAYQLVVR